MRLTVSPTPPVRMFVDYGPRQIRFAPAKDRARSRHGQCQGGAFAGIEAFPKKIAMASAAACASLISPRVYLAHHRRRSEAPRRGDRLLRRAPHLGPETLLHHPHLHCVIPGGGLSPDGARWISCRKGFFLPVAVLSCLFRRLFLEYLTAAFDAGKLKFFHTLEPLWERRAFLRTLAPLWNAKWVVHAKRPFAGPEQVLDYVGRYTHRVAISNNRLESMDDANVSFRWKDYRDYNKQKTMTLTGEEFIRRFLLHVVPRGFQRIRYYGFLANSCREQKLARCRELLANQKPPPPSDPPKRLS